VRVRAHTDSQEELNGEDEGEYDGEDEREDLHGDPARIQHDERDAHEHPLLGAGPVEDPPQGLAEEKRAEGAQGVESDKR
jgi:hypothetical protein